MQARTLSELTTLTGLKPRTVQFWTSNGVLYPEEGTKHGGPGIHRKYNQTEVIIACLMAELSRFNIQVGKLVSIAAYIRESIDHCEWYEKVHELSRLYGFGSEEMLSRLPPLKTNPKYIESVNGSIERLKSYGSTADHVVLTVDSQLERTYEAITNGINGESGHLFITFNGDDIEMSSTIDDDFSLTNGDMPAVYIAINLKKILPKVRQ